MLLLALDTSTPAVTTALLETVEGQPRVLAESTTVDARRHGELLAPAIRAVLAEAGVGSHELAAVAVGLGPGPFTGLRVGGVPARALAHALAIPGYGECSLDAVAAEWLGTGPVVAATDARRREVYWAAYGPDGTRCAGPHVERPEELAARLRAAAGDGAPPHGAQPRVVGPAAHLYADRFGPLADPRAAAEPGYPRAATLARLVLARRRVPSAPADPLVPLYLRRPDAVEPGPRKVVTVG